MSLEDGSDDGRILPVQSLVGTDGPKLGRPRGRPKAAVGLDSPSLRFTRRGSEGRMKSHVENPGDVSASRSGHHLRVKTSADVMGGEKGQLGQPASSTGNRQKNRGNSMVDKSGGRKAKRPKHYEDNEIETFCAGSKRLVPVSIT